MNTADADRNLLFGMLALQNGLIGQVELVAAFQSWTMDKGRPLADHLVERGDLDALLGEIARGGMGAVLKGRDPDLGRDLALKVLLDQHRDRADLVDRFVEEAQICGQLQHPGVVPVYELGTLPDRRPFFAMKLVKGQTLAALLARPIVARRRAAAVPVDLRGGLPDRGLRPRPGGDPSRPEAVERDGRGVRRGAGDGLGPGQGAAAGRPAAREPAKAPPVDETVVATLRSKGDSDLSQAGSVLGTPAYMAPEQARGETEAIDRRADVFALGSILCEILTGSPGLFGDSRDRDPPRRGPGRHGRRAGPARRAARPTSELIALARDCLAAEREGSPGRCRCRRRAGSPATWRGCRSGCGPRSWPAPPRRPAPRKPRPRRPPSAGPGD